MQTEQKIIEIISTLLQTDPLKIKPDSSPNSLDNWDSVMHLNIMHSIEEEFNVVFTNEQIVDSLTVKDIIATLELIRK